MNEEYKQKIWRKALNIRLREIAVQLEAVNPAYDNLWQTYLDREETAQIAKKTSDNAYNAYYSVLHEKRRLDEEAAEIKEAIEEGL
jgi:hypothetical protein